MKPKKTLPPTIEWSLLGFLAEAPMHGYEIFQRLSDAAGLGIVWYIKQSHLYTILSRLEDRGYIAHVLEPQEARPPRKVYSLTPEGELALRSWISTPVEHGRDFRLEFLAKFNVAQREGEETVRELLAAQRVTCQAWCADLEALLSQQGRDTFEGLVYRFRLGQIQAMLTWLDECAAVFDVAA
jgi:PadR family transcriptional regulator, regulatory protein AphA